MLIYPGAAAPLHVPLPSVEPQQPYDVEGAILACWEHDELSPRGQAIELMRHTIRQYPGEVVLLAIGPLTNITLLFAADPRSHNCSRAWCLGLGRSPRAGRAPT